MIFKVIDTRTGKEPTSRVIDNIGKKGGLLIYDIDQFFVGEDGSLVLVDDCGNMTYCDTTRFKVVTEQRIGEQVELEGIKDDICNNYCKWPDVWDEEAEGCDLSESDYCRECPLNRL